MFELNKNIENWQKELAANQSMKKSDVNELVSHLKDSIEELGQKGLSDEESFWVAKHRLGETQALSTEYSKVNQSLIWQTRLVWLLLGYFIFNTFIAFANLIVIPFHMIQIPWLFIKTSILGSEMPVPIPLFLFVLTIVSGIFYLISHQKLFSRFHHFNFIFQIRMGYKFIFIVLVLYLISVVSRYLSTILIASNNDIATIGTLSLSSSMFSILWNIFLVISLVLFSFLIFKRRKEQIRF